MDLPEINQQPIKHVDMTPDKDLAIRILEAYLENTKVVWTSELDNPLIQQKQRKALLKEAILRLHRMEPVSSKSLPPWI
jgi:hypothetical protein